MFAPSLNLNLGRQEEMLNITNLNTVVIHSGTFHLDDVLFVAMAQLARTFNSLPLLTIVRSNRVQPEWTLENGYLVGDVGNGQYDHHDATPKLRENGEPYAAAGLLFRDLWQSLGLSESAFLAIDKEFIAPSDLHDCTGCGNEMARLIKALNPNWDEPSSPDAINSQFGKAVDIVITLLDAQLNRVRSAEKLAQEAAVALENADGQAIYLDRYIPVGKDARIKKSSVLFIGFPSLRGGYQLSAIKLEDGTSKKLFPRKYRGNPDQSVGMTFCHEAGFTASFVSREAAKQFVDSQDWSVED